jgi:hypothetical protein
MALDFGQNCIYSRFATGTARIAHSSRVGLRTGLNLFRGMDAHARITLKIIASIFLLIFAGYGNGELGFIMM